MENVWRSVVNTCMREGGRGFGQTIHLAPDIYVSDRWCRIENRKGGLGEHRYLAVSISISDLLPYGLNLDDSGKKEITY